MTHLARERAHEEQRESAILGNLLFTLEMEGRKVHVEAVGGHTKRKNILFLPD